MPARYLEFFFRAYRVLFQGFEDEIRTAGNVGSRTDLGRHGGGIGRDHDFFGDRMVPGVSGLIPKIRFNLARTPVILYFTELKISISFFFKEQKTFEKYRDCF